MIAGRLYWIYDASCTKNTVLNGSNENSFERMWCISTDFYVNDRGSFSQMSWSIGDLYWRWPWLCLRCGMELKLSITSLVRVNRIPITLFFSLQPKGVVTPSYLIQLVLFVYGEMLLGLNCGIFLKLCTFTLKGWNDQFVQALINYILTLLMMPYRWSHIHLYSFRFAEPQRIHSNPYKRYCLIYN